MGRILCLIYSPFRLLLILVLAPIATLAYWLILLMTLPLIVFRKVLAFIARRADPELIKMVNTLGHVLSRDYASWCTSPSHVITVVLKFNGSISLAELRQLVLQRWVHKMDVKRPGVLELPELQQYFTKRLGFLFYKWEAGFEIEHHVNVYNNKKLLPNPATDVVNEPTFMRIWEEMITRPLEEKRSPWDVHLIPNYESPEKGGSGGGEQESLVIFRIHHGLCDGILFYKLLLLLTDNGLGDLENEISAFKKAPPYLDFFLNFNALICGPTSVLRRFSKGIDTYNPLHPSIGKKTGRGSIVRTTINIEQIKKVSRVHLDVSFHSVLIAALAGAIRNYLLGSGHRIPISPIRVGLPIPKPGHTHKLRNEYLVSVVDLPVDKKTAKERLFTVERRLRNIKTEGFMPFNSQAWKAIGLLPSKMVKALTSKSAVTVTYSEIKGPRKPLTVLGGRYELLDLVFAFGLGTDDCGVAFNSLSYKDKVHIMLTVDQGLAQSKDKAEKLLNLVEKELEQLQYGDATNL